MFQSRALRGCFLLFVITSSLVKAEVFVDDDVKAVIIQGKSHLYIYFRDLLIFCPGMNHLNLP